MHDLNVRWNTVRSTAVKVSKYSLIVAVLSKRSLQYFLKVRKLHFSKPLYLDVFFALFHSLFHKG